MHPLFVPALHICMASENNNYTLPIKQLPVGSHDFKYTLNREFFADLEQDEISDGIVNVVVNVAKGQRNITMNIAATGKVVVTCDRCLAPLTLDMEADDFFNVIFGEEYAEEGDNVVVVPEQDGEFDVSWLIYETILLSLPFNHTHEEGECNPEMEETLKRYTPNGEDEQESESDPRWDALKNMHK